MCALGNLYVAGRGVPQDAKHGAELCRQGAEAGNEDAQTDLGNLYVQRIGVPRDMVLARHWYELAAVQGQANADFVLGQIYWNGDGVAPDQAKAAELWKAAYRGGRLDAAALLASWNFVRWMAAHPKGDLSGLSEAIAWEKEAVKAARDAKARGQADDMLKFMRVIRDSSQSVEK
jgi:TPR repeat protein